MTGVFCFSGSGHSLRVAEFIARELKAPIRPIAARVPEETARFETGAVVFPVYCQGVPAPVKDFLKNSDLKNTALVATYGGISWGNVLREAEALVKGTVIAGACVPTGHTLLRGGTWFDEEALGPLLERLRAPRRARMPGRRKNLFADFLPTWRSRVSVKLIRAHSCDSCGLCTGSCPVGAIKNGVADNSCIRCLRCVANCPQKALSFQNSAVLEKYLAKKRREKGVELYL